MAYFEGTSVVVPGDPIGLRINGRQRREAVVTAISRFRIEIWTPERRIEVDLRPLNEATWDHKRRLMAAQAGVSLPLADTVMEPEEDPAAQPSRAAALRRPG